MKYIIVDGKQHSVYCTSNESYEVIIRNTHSIRVVYTEFLLLARTNRKRPLLNSTENSSIQKHHTMTVSALQNTHTQEHAYTITNLIA